LGEYIRGSKIKSDPEEFPEREFNRLNSVNLTLEDPHTERSVIRDEAE